MRAIGSEQTAMVAARREVGADEDVRVDQGAIERNGVEDH